MDAKEKLTLQEVRDQVKQYEIEVNNRMKEICLKCEEPIFILLSSPHSINFTNNEDEPIQFKVLKDTSVGIQRLGKNTVLAGPNISINRLINEGYIG